MAIIVRCNCEQCMEADCITVDSDPDGWLIERDDDGGVTLAVCPKCRPSLPGREARDDI